MMRRLIVMLAALAFSAPALAQPVANGTPLWRMHTENLAGDRAMIRTCLAGDEAGEGYGCALVVQAACLSSHDPDDIVPALQRQCDWRAIAAWEDEMNDALAHLRGRLDGVDASQSAWQTSMLADVGVGMDALEGGSLAGPVGARIRARATAERALYLRDLVRTFVEE
ncbi:MAG: lysozyme inhibitor LprI family protein [Pseudomonadota bacterium]